MKRSTRGPLSEDRARVGRAHFLGDEGDDGKVQWARGVYFRIIATRSQLWALDVESSIQLSKPDTETQRSGGRGHALLLGCEATKVWLTKSSYQWHLLKRKLRRQ